MNEGSAADVGSAPFFFVHIMKTAGTTFVQHIHANFAPDEVYPHPERGEERRRAYYMLEQLRALSEERRRRIRVYVGHFPYVARSFVGRDTITFTLLRDPVERTISVLRHCKRYHEHQRHLSLDEIYDDAFVFPLYIHNHQAKMFAMTLDDRLESHLDVIDVDERRLDIAKANLARVDVVGFTEQYDEFIADMSHRFGWQFGAVPNMRVSEEEWNISDALRERIVVDNAADVAFYEFARELCAGPRSRA